MKLLGIAAVLGLLFSLVAIDLLAPQGMGAAALVVLVCVAGAVGLARVLFPPFPPRAEDAAATGGDDPAQPPR